MLSSQGIIQLQAAPFAGAALPAVEKWSAFLNTPPPLRDRLKHRLNSHLITPQSFAIASVNCQRYRTLDNDSRAVSHLAVIAPKLLFSNNLRKITCHFTDNIFNTLITTISGGMVRSPIHTRRMGTLARLPLVSRPTAKSGVVANQLLNTTCQIAKEQVPIY